VENYCLQGKLLYHLGKLCILMSERVHIIREAHTSLVSGHFGVGKTMAHLQRFCYWPQMKAIVTKYVKGCVMCYLRTRCHSESLIPILVCKVWKMFVNSGTAWSLSCHSVVHLVYKSS
jgi:hypothetical protein